MVLSNGGFEIKSNHIKFHGEEEGLGLGFMKFTRGLGRKRIRILKSNQEITSNSDALDSSPVKIPLKIHENETKESNRSMLESLHQYILIRVLCHVDHEDLTRLKRVSKTIRKAVIKAKKSYFDYNTPRKRMHFQDPILIHEEENSYKDDDIEPPNAPIRRMRNINRESDLSKISMVLFK